MSELDKLDVESEVYRLDEKGETVATAKSQFSDEYDVPYSNLKGNILYRTGKGWSKHPAFCVVSETPEVPE